MALYKERIEKSNQHSNSETPENFVFVSLCERWDDDDMRQIYQDLVPGFHKIFSKYNQTWTDDDIIRAAIPVNRFDDLCKMFITYMKDTGSDFYYLSLYIPMAKTAFSVNSSDDNPLLFFATSFVNGYTSEKLQKEIVDSCPCDHSTLRFQSPNEKTTLLPTEEIIFVIFEAGVKGHRNEGYLEAWQNFHRDHDTYHDTWISNGLNIAIFPFKEWKELNCRLSEFMVDNDPEYYTVKLFVPLFKTLFQASIDRFKQFELAPIPLNKKNKVAEFEDKLLTGCPSKYNPPDIKRPTLD